jgi:hypothetical protein
MFSADGASPTPGGSNRLDSRNIPVEMSVGFYLFLTSVFFALGLFTVFDSAGRNHHQIKIGG